jgi:tRNA nucleotidyltransferase (CCA-adding enzyme)
MAEFTAFDELLASILPAHSVYAVGGRVRDELRTEFGQAALPSKDADYVVTGVQMEDLAAKLSVHGRIDRVGASFSVIKFTRGKQTVDIALPRRERSSGVGHRDFIIESSPEIPLVDDLARRDFRMNMIARALTTGELLDPYHGADDIQAKRIDILSEETFREDPLRMLRACQFAARFEYRPTPRTEAAIAEAHQLIGFVSPQRVGEEFSKLLLLAKRPSIGFELMRSTMLLSVIWPELAEGVGVEQNEWHRHDVYRHNLETLDAMPLHDLVARAAALLHDVGKPRVKEGPHFYRHEVVGAEMVREMLARIAMSNEVIDRVAHLVRHHMYSIDPKQTDAAMRRFINRIGAEQVERMFALRHADICGSGLPKRSDENELFEGRVRAEMSARPPMNLATLEISGRDVIQALIDAGEPASFRGDRRVGFVLRQLLDEVLEMPERNERGWLLERIRGLLASHQGAVANRD